MITSTCSLPYNTMLPLQVKLAAVIAARCSAAVCVVLHIPSCTPAPCTHRLRGRPCLEVSSDSVEEAQPRRHASPGGSDTPGSQVGSSGNHTYGAPRGDNSDDSLKIARNTASAIDDQKHFKAHVEGHVYAASPERPWHDRSQAHMVGRRFLGNNSHGSVVPWQYTEWCLQSSNSGAQQGAWNDIILYWVTICVASQLPDATQTVSS
jgi:hypothetical protein